MNIKHFATASATIATLVALAPATSLAQAWPSRPIRFITQNGAGSTMDVYYRIFAQGIEKNLGQPVTVENRVGAGGTIAVDAIAKSPPDGYTLGMGAAAPMSVGPLLRKTPYDPVKDFSHITQTFEIPQFLAVGTRLKINSVPELIKYLKANPGKINYGTNGVGSTPHLAGEWFNLKYGVKMVHVPYKASFDYDQAWTSNAIQVSIYGGPALTKLGDTVKILAVTAPTRDSAYPQFPTAEEAGIPGFYTGSWGSVIGPAGLSAEIVQRVNRAVIDDVTQPDVKAKLEKIGYHVKVGTPEEALKLLKTEIAKWKAVIDKAGIKID